MREKEREQERLVCRKVGTGVCFDTLIPQPCSALCGDLSWEEERDEESYRDRKGEGGVSEQLNEGGVFSVGFEEGIEGGE